MKRIIAFFSACTMFIASTIFSYKTDGIQVNAATYEDINQNDVFLKQEEWDSCTLAAAAMLVRRVAIMRGDTDWQTITEAELKSLMDWDNSGLSWDFTCRGIRIIHKGDKYSLPSDYDEKEKLLKDLLEKSPEGIIAYDRDYPHAILLTDCAGSTFYCADPANSTPDGRISISESIISIDELDDYWYCTSPLVSLDNGSNSTTVENSAYVPASTFVYNNHVYAIYDGLLLYEDAKALAEQFGGHLATITSQEENTVITERLQKTEGYEYWIGLERDSDTFRWITGETFVYDNFAAGEPNSSGTENAVCIYGGTSYVENGHTIGTWNDEKDEEMRYGFILEIDDIDTLQPAVTAEYNGHKYYRFDEHFNWTEANAIATALGGNLVIINDADENNFLEDALFRAEPNNWLYWIGLFAPNGEYQWVDGSAPDYLNWNATEPDCRNGVEFYAEIYTGGIGYAGKWNDNANSSNEDEGFIVEIEIPAILSGDVNCDGAVKINDAILLNRFLAEDSEIEMTDEGMANADVTSNGTVSTADSTELLRILAGFS